MRPFRLKSTRSYQVLRSKPRNQRRWTCRAAHILSAKKLRNTLNDFPTAHQQLPEADNPPSTIKIEFKATPEAYNMLAHVALNIKYEKIDTVGVVQRVGDLLQSNPYRLHDFNIALYPHDLSDGNLGCQTLSSQAGARLHVAQLIFKVTLEVYRELIGIVKELRREGIDTLASIRRVGELIHSNAHLVHGFNIILLVLNPTESGVSPQNILSNEQQSIFSESIDYSSSTSRTKSTEYGRYYTRMALSEDYIESGASDVYIPHGYHNMPPHIYKQFVEATMDDVREARKAREALMASASREVPRPTTLLGTAFSLSRGWN